MSQTASTTTTTTNITPTTSKSISPETAKGSRGVGTVEKPVALSSPPPTTTRPRSGSNAVRQGLRQVQLQKLRLSQQQQPQQQQQNDGFEPSSPYGQQQGNNDVDHSDRGSRYMVSPSPSTIDQETAESQQQLSTLDQIRPALDDTTARVYGALESVMPRSKSEQVKLDERKKPGVMEWCWYFFIIIYIDNPIERLWRTTTQTEGVGIQTTRRPGKVSWTW